MCFTSLLLVLALVSWLGLFVLISHSLHNKAGLDYHSIVGIHLINLIVVFISKEAVILALILNLFTCLLPLGVVFA